MDMFGASGRRKKTISEGAEALSSRIRKVLGSNGHRDKVEDPEDERLSVSTLSECEMAEIEAVAGPSSTKRRQDTLTKKLTSNENVDSEDKQDECTNRDALHKQVSGISLGRSFFRSVSAKTSFHRSSSGGMKLLSKYALHTKLNIKSAHTFSSKTETSFLCLNFTFQIYQLQE